MGRGCQFVEGSGSAGAGSVAAMDDPSPQINYAVGASCIAGQDVGVEGGKRPRLGSGGPCLPNSLHGALLE